MRKIMYDGALFILHRKLRTLKFSRRHRKSTLKKNLFVVSKMLNFLISFFYANTENFGFALFHLKGTRKVPKSDL